MAQLTYYIFEGVLVGNAGGRSYQLTAGSGGGAGSTTKRPTSAANNPYATGLKTSESGSRHVHGGPLPVGRYRILPPAQHPHLGLSARLEALSGAARPGRAGFFIHGRGTHGSDGCIVPMHELRPLMASLTKDQGGTLVVLEAMGDSRFV
jgi:hypothetical protein